MLLAIYAMVKGGLTSFPYHAIGASGRNSICTIYSDTDIARIAVAAFAFITFHESYCNMMIQWLDRAETVEEVEQIVYGANLPADLPGSESWARLRSPCISSRASHSGSPRDSRRAGESRNS